MVDMGFRSTLAAQDSYGIAWPEWFREKYGRWFDAEGRLYAAQEVKVYSSPLTELPQDIQAALAESGWFDRTSAPASYFYVWLHECGGVTLVQVDRDRITILEPTGWEPVEPDEGQSGHHETWHNTPHDYTSWLGPVDETRAPTYAMGVR